MMRRLALGLLLSGGVVVPVFADGAASAAAGFDLCRERVQAVSLAPSEGKVVVHVRLTDSAAGELARRTEKGQAVVIHAGSEPFARFVVSDALRARPPGTIQSTPRSTSRARGLAEAVWRPCSSPASR